MQDKKKGDAGGLEAQALVSVGVRRSPRPNTVHARLPRKFQYVSLWHFCGQGAAGQLSGHHQDVGMMRSQLALGLLLWLGVFGECKDLCMELPAAFAGCPSRIAPCICPLPALQRRSPRPRT